MHLGPRQRRINEDESPYLAATRLAAFDTLGKPLTTNLAAGVDLRTVQEMLGHSSIVLTADTYISVIPELAFDAAERIAALIIQAGCLVPGTRKRRRRDAGKGRGRRNTRRPPGRRSRAHPARQLGRPARRDHTGPR